ncbi:MAG: IclR family transcriptional regulator [Proteobacteria bacterium]|nr:IclR family transcriptional regulator [Pseudomonadota bacterium]
MTEPVATVGATTAASPPPRGDGRSGRAEGISIQSVDRALTLLETIAQEGGEITLTALALRTGLNISTCHHLLSTLVRRGYVARIARRRSYALGARILHLGHACLQIDLPRRAEPYVSRISQASGETVHLAVLQGDTIVTLLKRESRHAVRVDTGNLGQADAAHATATGKAMLAWLPEDEMKRILAAHGMARFTENTIVDPAAFTEELRLVRRNGYSMDREEFQPGVVCIGAAVRDYAGAVVGAISASVPSMRAGEDRLALLRQEVVCAVRALSAELGGAVGERMSLAAE